MMVHNYISTHTAHNTSHNTGQSARSRANRRRALSATTSLRGPLYALLMAGMVTGAPATAQAIDNNATPQGGEVVGGQADFDRPADNKLNINQGSDRAVIYWKSFNIGKDAATEFKQPGSSSLAVNRVTGGGSDPSKILGQLTANGKLMVLDQNGVFFGQNAVVDTNGIIASTGDVSTNAVMSGQGEIELSDFGDAAVTNKGTINVAQAGLAAFVAPTVKNSGVINASLGKVAFAAGSKVTVDLYGDKLVEIAVDDKLEDALLENTGTINAAGGQVTLSTQVAKSVVDNVINMDGVTRVASVEQQGGKIVLKGGDNGTVRIAGEMDASGKQGGGDVDITGENIYTTPDSTVSVSGDEAAGSAIFFADNNGLYTGTINALGGQGFVETSAANLGVQGDVNVGSGGEWLLDPTTITISNDSANNLEDFENLPSNTEEPVGGSDFYVSASSIVNQLDGGGNVTLQTLDNGNVNSGGTITVNAPIDTETDKTKDGDLPTLSLKAHKDIIVNRTIADSADSGDGLNVSLTTDWKNDGNTGDVTLNSLIKTNGGNFTASANDMTITSNGIINAGDGAVNIFRSRRGYINLADGTVTSGQGSDSTLTLGQSELNNITAGELKIGRNDPEDNLVQEINLDDVQLPNMAVELNAFRPGDSSGPDVEFQKTNNTFGSVTANANDDIVFRDGGGLKTEDNVGTSGNIILNADDNGMDEPSEDSNKIERWGSGDVEITAYNNIEMTTLNYALASSSFVTAEGGDNSNPAGDIEISLSRPGIIRLGDGAEGTMHISQTELSNMAAGSLQIGRDNADDSKTTDISVNGTNISHIGTVDLNALAASSVTYSGTNSFVDLNAKSDTINVNDGATVDADSIDFDAETVKLEGDLYAPTITGTATTVKVNDDDDFDNEQIQDGIDVAGSGATVNVGHGTYKESLDANVANLSLEGVNSGIPGDDNANRVEESRIEPDGSAGITVTADDVTIDGFEIYGGAPGIKLDGVSNTANNAIVKNNLIHHQRDGGSTEADGIQVLNAQGVTIKQNLIKDVGDETIYVTGHMGDFGNENALTVTANKLGQNAQTSGGTPHTIELIDASGGARFKDNIVEPTGTGDNNAAFRIKGDGSGLGTIEIIDNSFDSEADGIFIEGDLGDDATFDIADNNIFAGTGVNDDGIHVVHTGDGRSDADLDIYGNQIGRLANDDENKDAKAGAGGDGIEVDSVNDAVIGVLKNKDSNAAGEGANEIYGAHTGIKLRNSNDTRIVNNTVKGIQGHQTHTGIDVSGSSGPDYGVWVYGSDIDNVSDYGIRIADSDGDPEDFSDPDIWGNNINPGEDNNATGILVEDSDYTSIGVIGHTQLGSGPDDGNVISNAGSGIVVKKSSDNIPGDGIRIEGGGDIDIDGNTITNSDINGIYASGANNGTIELTNNTLTDNPTGMRFESGEVDLAGIGDDFNTIIGGTNGIVMDNGVPTNGNSADARDLSFAGKTLGNTVFENFAGEEKFFVRLEGRTLFEPDEPTIINGVNATYGFDANKTIRPVDLGTPVTFDGNRDLLRDIEAKLFDFDDPGNRGQIFAGAFAEATFDSEEDVFLEIEPFEFLSEGINVTINGVNLPGGDAVNVAAIEPAAGGGDSDDDQTLAQQVADVEPEAGGGQQATPCTNAGANVMQRVSYTMGVSREQLLSDTAQCQGGAGQ